MFFYSSSQLNKKVILFIQKCYRSSLPKKKKKKERERETEREGEKIDDVLCGADNATMKSMR